MSKELREKWAEVDPECGEGWFSIIDDTLAEIRETLEAEDPEDPDSSGASLGDLDVQRVATWKGLLKFWIKGPDIPELGPILEHAKLRSLWTCEVCGEDGRMREEKQVVRCRDCAVEQELQLIREEMN
jgi:hypothetical protein